jgi:hypothetical protein
MPFKPSRISRPQGRMGCPLSFTRNSGNYWGTKAEVLAVLNGDPFPESCNDIVIVLIPKVKNPEKLQDLRPIAFKMSCTSWFQWSPLIASRIFCQT